MGLFKLENNKVVIDLEARIIPEFRNLIAYDKDRFKKQALKEFAYIYFMYDYKSFYSNYSSEDRHNKLIKELELGKDWKVHKILQSAIDKYIELQETPTIKTLKATKEALLTASKVIEKLREVINKSLDELENNSDMEEILTNVEKLLKISSTLPTTVNTLQQLEKKVKEEQLGDSKIRGGGQVNLFENPE